MKNKKELTILHLEDNKQDGMLVRELLEEEGLVCTMTRVESEEDFLRELQSGSFDLIISDFTIPSFNGMFALDLSRGNAPDTPFIFFSGTIGEDVAVESLQKGATDYVLKTKIERLVPAIRRALVVGEERRKRRQAEEEHKKSEDRYRTLAKNFPNGAVLLYDQDLRFVIADGKGLARVNLSSEMLTGRGLREVLPVEMRDVLEPACRNALSGIPSTFEMPYGGRIFEVHVHPIPDDHGNIVSGLVVTLDISERKELEAQLFRTQRLESIGTLAGGIAHDLNNVLGPILLSVDIIRKKVSDETVLKLLDMVEATANRGADMVRQVLTFARGVEGQRSIIDLCQLIQELTGITRTTFPKSVQTLSECPKDLWHVSADATQLHQVLMNLCVNARDAMPNGGSLRIIAENMILDEQYVKMNSEAKTGPHVLIRISDTGAGIPQRVIERIFDPFFTTKEVGKGTGLGLSTARTIIKNHGGFIRIYSEVGKGTSFNVFLPAMPSPKTVQSEREKTAVPIGHGELVLIVDDEASVREIMNEALRAFGYETLQAADGAEAVVAYTTHKEQVDVVLTDMAMPIMDGTATIRALKKMNPAMKIIVSSGLPEHANNPEVLRCAAFMHKPFTTQQLLETLQRVLGVPER